MESLRGGDFGGTFSPSESHSGPRSGPVVFYAKAAQRPHLLVLKSLNRRRLSYGIIEPCQYSHRRFSLPQSITAPPMLDLHFRCSRKHRLAISGQTYMDRYGLIMRTSIVRQWLVGRSGRRKLKYSRSPQSMLTWRQLTSIPNREILTFF